MTTFFFSKVTVDVSSRHLFYVKTAKVRLSSIGSVAVWCLLTLYSFLAMAVVCDAYLVPALEILCERLELIVRGFLFFLR